MPRRRRLRRRSCWPPGRLPWLPSGGRGVVFLPVTEEQDQVAEMEPVIIRPEELEAYRLVYLEGRTQEEAAQIMGVSRGSLWRLLDSARKKIGLALIQRRPLVVLD